MIKSLIHPNPIKNDLEFYDRTAHQWWDKTADIYALNQLNPARFSYFERLISDWSGLHVLDVGCGGGYSCEVLAKKGAIATGIDQSHACIEAAQHHAMQMALPIAYQHGHAERLPFADHQFDVVVCVDVLEHVSDWQQTVREIFRVLKPGGIFCFDTINKTDVSRLILITLLENILRKIPAGVHDWEQFIPPNELSRFLTQTGFASVTMNGFDLFGRSPWGYMKTLWHYQTHRAFNIGIDDDLSVMYIGWAIAPSP
ncbi:MAG: bifunctional 2-polyprenyl-6-hydroxyphenol methylase/3-demethylubiquinol 3-O-methyltransferase UbiG [Elainellaceae cyanobacterium]